MTGKVLATLPIGNGTDGGGFNPNTMEALSSQRDGTLTIIKESSPTSFAVEQTVETKAGCKTCSLDTKNNRIVLICTERAPQPAAATPETNAPAAGSVAADAAAVRAISTCYSWGANPELLRARLVFGNGNIDAKGVAQIHFVFLFLGDDLAEHFAEREFAHLFRLADALAILRHGFAFVFEIRAQHFGRVVGGLDRFGHDTGMPPRVIDLFGELERVRQFLTGVLLQFPRNVHVLRRLSAPGCKLCRR